MRILYYTGGAYASRRLTSCWWRNKAKLEAMGMVQIPWLDLATPGEKITPANIEAKLDNPALAPKLRQWLQELQSKTDKPKLLYHADPLALTFRHERVKLLHRLLCRYFPESQHEIVFSPSPADLEIEAAAAWQCLLGQEIFSRFIIGRLQIKPTPRLRPIVQDYDTMVGVENVQTLVWQEDNTLEHEFLKNFVCSMGFDAVPSDFDLTVSRVPAIPARDLMIFCESVNPLLRNITKPTPFNWYSFPGFWKAGCMEHSLFDRTTRNDLNARFDKGDDAFLRERFGFSLDDITPEHAPGREESNGWRVTDADRPFTYADALRIAKMLPVDFLQNLATGSHSEEYFQRPQTRLCLAAIREAASGATHIQVTDARPLVAVLTATYNHAAFITQNIESVLEQKTSFPIEHIIADDGSTDGTQGIIRDYASRYPHIKPIFQKVNSRDSRNYQCLYDMANTRYVALCEGDDYFADENKLQMQYDFLEANPDCALHFHRVRVIHEGGTIAERIHPRAEDIPGGFKPVYTLDDLVLGNMIQTNSVMYRWRFPDGLPLWYNPFLMPADWYMHLLHAEIGNIGFFENIMSVYRRHSAAQFYLAEVDRLKHRIKMGKQELRFFAAMDEHFLFRFKDVYQDLAKGVLADLLQYGEKTDDMQPFEEAVETYPQFGVAFLRGLKLSV